MLTFEMDFGGGLRTPWFESGAGYFLRMVPLLSCIIAAPDDVTCYIWDERTGGKGVNETLSCLHKKISAAVAKSSAEAIHLILWWDGCAGQCHNYHMTSFLAELVDPTSSLYIPKLQRIDAKKCVKGHSFMTCDRCIRVPKMAGRKLRCGVHVPLEKDLEHIAPANRDRYTSWEELFRKAMYKGLPFETVVMEQADFINWKAYFDQPAMPKSKGGGRDLLDSSGAKTGEKFKISSVSWQQFGTGESSAHAAAASGVWTAQMYEATIAVPTGRDGAAAIIAADVSDVSSAPCGSGFPFTRLTSPLSLSPPPSDCEWCSW